MKNSDLYARLELITSEFDYSASTNPSKVSRFWGRFKAYLYKAGQSWLQAFCGSWEPRIVTKRDREGNTFFSAYDPVTQAHHRFTSERELRIWLDQRYYQ